MRVLFLIVLFSAILFKTSFSQELTPKLVVDTIETEEIIYDVDTVYLQADTISLFDTIVHYTAIPARKLPIFVEVSGSSYVSGMFNFINIDTLTIRKTVNYSGALTLGYSYKTFFLGINMGFSQLEENLAYGRSFNSSDAQSTSGYYDSLTYSSNCSFTSYFNYLNAALVVGKKWTGNGKFSYRAIFHAGCDILLSHRSYSVLSDGENKFPIPESDLRKLALYFDLSASVGYRFWRKTDLFVAPYSKLTLKSGKEYSLSNRVICGLRLGLITYF
ncbi:MAG TPA: hypothetical protein VHO72_17140 [Bacteroidales bacterium]|nr:hypothetical protein [Bacteroidales bacterium]